VSAALLDGKALAKRLNQELVRPRAALLPRPPGLAVVLVGEDPASKVYVGRKGEVAGRLGFHHRQITLPADTSEAALLAIVDSLNDDPAIDGVLVQLPLPKHIDATRVLDRVSPDKDVDGFHPENAGRLSQGRPRFVPCTPFGVMRLLDDVKIPLAGRRALVVGRSNIVGRPMAQLLEQANATVTLAHSRTAELPGLVRQAEIVVAAIGRAEHIQGDWIQDGAVVVDVGMNRLEDGRLVGDVAFDAAAERAAWITPVPGGVGPMTIAMLMQSTLLSAERRLTTT
jgi:methylenetetrahydrofolate dehydrogenase (NADP+)/methenyltetrahydrofolate cyclohydrolase